MRICKIFTFDSAHQLKYYEGACQNLHGHTYRLEVTLQSKILMNGILMDFKSLKETVDELIISKMDHKYLNDVFPFEPTAENMANWIFRELKEASLPVYKVRLYETPTSYAEVVMNDRE